MRTVNASNTDDILLGYQGEANRTQVVFDVSDLIDEFPEGTVSIVTRRPRDNYGHTVSGVVLDGETVSWTVDGNETAESGFGKIQLIYTVDNVIVKTQVWNSIIKKSIQLETVEPTTEDQTEEPTESETETTDENHDVLIEE